MVQTRPPAQRSAARPGLMRPSAWVAAGTWGYVAVLGVIWAVLNSLGDRWWPATVLMFGPRWVWGLPLLGLVPALVVWRPRLLWVAGAALLFTAGPLMGFCLPWRAWAAAPAAGLRVRVLTCNIHRRQLEATSLGQLIGRLRPDIIALQDWTSHHQSAVFENYSCTRRRADELLLASRYPIGEEDALTGPDFADGKGAVIRWDLASPIGTLHVFNVHLYSPRRAFEALLDHHRRGLEELERNSELRQRQSQAARRAVESVRGPVILAGDFNTPTESTIFRQSWTGLTDAFSAAGLGWGNTYFTRRSSMRIDHVLTGPGWRCVRCWVGPDVGSPHRPVIADVEWNSPDEPDTP